MGALLKSKWVWIAAGVAILIGAYAFVGFKIAPGMVRKQATQFVRETYKRELKLGEIRINPFKLTFEARDIALPDRDGQPMLGLRRFFIDFELSSLWHRAYVFRDVQIEAPYLRPVLRPDGSMNLADLAVPQDPNAPKEPDAGIPALWVKALAVSQGKIDYVDQARREPFQAEFAPVEFTLQDFRTTPEGGGFHLAATGYGGAEFDWKGRFSLAPSVSSEGDFSIRDLSVPRVADLLGDALPFSLDKGSLELGGSYRVTLADVLDLRLKVPTVAFTDLGLRARGVEADWISVPELKVEGIEVVMPVQNVSIAAVTVNGLKATGWLNPDGTISLAQLFAPAAPAATPAALPTTPVAAAPVKTATLAKPAAAQHDWKVQVAAINVNAAALELEDRLIAPGTPWKFSPVNLHVKDVTLDFTQPMQVEMDATINDQAQFKASGSLAIDPMVADLDVALEKARMRILQPYILPYADLTITEGTVGLAGKVKMSPPERSGPEIDFAGDVTVDGFKSTDNTLHEPFIDFSRVQVQKLHYEMSPDAVHIDRILVREPYARVIISREQIINISAVLDPKAAAADAQAKRATKSRAGNRNQGAEAATRETGGGGKEDSRPGAQEEWTGRPCGKGTAAGGHPAHPHPRSGHRAVPDELLGPERAAELFGGHTEPQWQGDRAVIGVRVARHRGHEGQSRGIRAGHDCRYPAAIRVRPLHGHWPEVREHIVAAVQSVFRAVRRLQHRQGQAFHRPALPDTGPQARCETPHRDRPARMGRCDAHARAKPRCR